MSVNAIKELENFARFWSYKVNSFKFGQHLVNFLPAFEGIKKAHSLKGI